MEGVDIGGEIERFCFLWSLVEDVVVFCLYVFFIVYKSGASSCPADRDFFFWGYPQTCP